MEFKFRHPIKAAHEILFMEDGMVIAVKPMQSLKAFPSISVTDGMDIPVKLLQPSNAFGPIQVTNGGRMTDARLVHPAKEEVSIMVTKGGTSMEVKPVQLANANPPILVIPEGRITDVKLVLPIGAP
jgi:hypothetical protein